MMTQTQFTVDDVQNFILNITPNQDWIYIFQPCSIGDILINGGLSPAVQKRKNKSATVLIAQDRMKNLGVTYENFANIIFLPNDTMNIVQQYFYATGDYEGDNYIYGHFHRPAQGGVYMG